MSTVQAVKKTARNTIIARSIGISLEAKRKAMAEFVGCLPVTGPVRTTPREILEKERIK